MDTWSGGYSFTVMVLVEVSHKAFVTVTVYVPAPVISSASVPTTSLAALRHAYPVIGAPLPLPDAPHMVVVSRQSLGFMRRSV